MRESVPFLSNVEQIMKTHVATVTANQSVSTVRAIAEENDGNPVPVVDQDNRMIGVVTADKLLVDGTSTAGQLASHPRMTVAPHESAFSVASRMLSRRVDWVPVIQNRKLVGTISRDCILAAFGETNRA